jgi:glycine hydroxymethyltransferase
MKEEQMIEIADLIVRVLRNKDDEKTVGAVRSRVKELCSEFPLYSGWTR